MRKPFVVEFTGTPEAGKTSCIREIIPLLEKSLSCSVYYNQESAEYLPATIPKGSPSAHLWMRSYTVKRLIEKLYSDCYDIIILDRGVIDSEFFGYLFYLSKNSSCDDDYGFKSYYTLIWNKELLPDLVISLKTSPEETIRRRGGEGKLVTLDWVSDYYNHLDAFLASIDELTVFELDTTHISQEDTVKIVTNQILTQYLNR